MNDEILEETDTSMKELQHVYPTKLLYEFSKKAVNYYVNGKQEELLGYIVGYKKENISLISNCLPSLFTLCKFSINI